MITFDQILPCLADLLKDQSVAPPKEYYPILINRDLNGRVRLILDARHETAWEDFWVSNTPGHELDRQQPGHPLPQLAKSIDDRLKPHTWPAEQLLLFEDDIKQLIESSVTFPLCDQRGDPIPGVRVVDRLATESIWSSIIKPSEPIPRVVFYSIKGGVGRSTALAACALALAEADQRVLLLDLDLESPGLSTSLLPEDRQPAFGITDWLVEDLVGNGDSIIEDLQAESPLPGRGEILVVPAHGRTPGEYISKLGRVWMPSVPEDGPRRIWSERLARLLDKLEELHRPDIVLIDSRAGIDEMASACLTDLGASRIYLFAQDSVQTWSGYRLLFQHWRQNDVAPEMRERLQLVAAMLPSWHDRVNEAATDLREQAYNLFLETLYDEQPAEIDQAHDQDDRGVSLESRNQADGSSEDCSNFSFDLNDQEAPHHACLIPWNQSFAGIASHYRRLDGIPSGLLESVYGELIKNLLINDLHSKLGLPS